MGSFVEVDTTNGRVRGIRFRGVSEFLGIPYGASTAGARLFAPPVAPEKWSGIRETMSFGDAAPQLDARLTDSGRMLDVHPHMYPKGGHPLDGVRMSEDCLVLNVWSPSVGEETKRPVMVWLHGGGFMAGSGGSVLYHGDQLAARGDVVVVNINHRLGILGYLALEYIDPDQFPYAGNIGMLDIVQALEWVRDNIAEFGDDPNNVTVFGQSGGGLKIHTLMAMPSADGLFHKAISQSGPGMRVSESADAEAAAHRVLEILGLSRHEVSKVRDLSMRDLLAVGGELHDGLLGCPHSLDLPFVFRNVDRTTFGGDREDRFEVSNNMALAWASFAHNGSPQHDAIPQWKPFDREGRAMMRIDVNWESTTSPETSVFPDSPITTW